MTLGFLTKWPQDMPDHIAGKPTYFMEKTVKSLKNKAGYFFPLKYQHCTYDLLKSLDLEPKMHTIRADKNNRWKAGNKIHPVINARTKDRFQFAPILKCVSIQKIEIKHFSSHIDVDIDGIPFLVEKNSKGRIFSYCGTIETLAKNDGFDSIHDFFSWFKEDFTGKIIHWTNLKY